MGARAQREIAGAIGAALVVLGAARPRWLTLPDLIWWWRPAMAKSRVFFQLIEFLRVEKKYWLRTVHLHAVLT
jgi:hypothetical protein